MEKSGAVFNARFMSSSANGNCNGYYGRRRCTRSGWRRFPGSTVNIQNKEILTLELQSRLFWLHERQEFIRLESERIVKEVEAGHDSMCVCCGGISWE